MRFTKFLKFGALALAATMALQGCTTNLIEGQKQELAVYQEKGLAVEEKSPGLAAGLGILPAAGYFYTGHWALAITTLPLYPFLGPLWMPHDAYQSALARNYYATKASVARERAKALRANDALYADQKLDQIQYMRANREIEDKYSAY